MKLYLASIFVNDQAKALAFYTDVLGFELKRDIPLGSHRWLTVTTRGAPNDMELLLEPDEHPAARAYSAAIKADGIPATSFLVENLEVEYQRLHAGGVTFVQQPMDAGPVRMAVIDDTCGNLVQLVEVRADATR
jgi:catechol 2,3-dioxygenase-like lactoylglutathione lyase family enzyme